MLVGLSLSHTADHLPQGPVILLTSVPPLELTMLWLPNVTRGAWYLLFLERDDTDVVDWHCLVCMLVMVEKF